MPRREGAAALAAEIAVVLTERGLGGDDVDLAIGSSAAPRPLAPRRGRAARWRSAADGAGESAAGAEPAPAASRAVGRRILALAYPDRIAK